MSGTYFLHDLIETRDGARIYFQVHGEGGPGWLLCDGLGCDGFVWKYLLPRLKRHGRVIRWHYRGHGRSTPGPDPAHLGMDAACEDLERVMERLGLERPVLLGHSMGVQVALEYHRRHPHAVGGLVLLCGSYGNPLDTFHDGPWLKRAFPLIKAAVERFPTAAAAVTRIGFRSELATQIALRFELNRTRIRRADLWPYFDHLARMDPAVFVQTLASLSEHSAWEHLAQVDVPTLVVGGEHDRFTPLSLSVRMAEAIPGAEKLWIEGGTHLAPLEEPDQVGQAVESFLLAQVELGSAA